MSCPAAFPQPEVTNASLAAIHNATSAETLYADLRHAVYYVVIPGVLCVGLLGNAINLAVFVYRMSQACVDRMERSAIAGLIAIALSDLLFCLVGVPAAFVPRSGHIVAIKDAPGDVFGFYYNAYKGAFVNLFLLISTWLIVIISVERYMAVCHPIKARWMISLRKTVVTQLTAALLAVCFCLPEFLHYHARSRPCRAGCTCYYLVPNSTVWGNTFSVIYKITWLVAGTLLPLAVLVYCNLRLIIVLYQSKTLGIADPDRYCTTRITVLVVAIITTYFILVVPSSLVDLIVWTSIDNVDSATLYRMRTAVVVCNFLQAVKFASNFILYCSINKQFRRSLGRAMGRMSRSRRSSRMMESDTTKRIDLIETNR